MRQDLSVLEEANDMLRRHLEAHLVDDPVAERLLHAFVVLLLPAPGDEGGHLHLVHEEVLHRPGIAGRVRAEEADGREQSTLVCGGLRRQHHGEVRTLREAEDRVYGRVLLQLRLEPLQGLPGLLVGQPVLLVEGDLVEHLHGLALEEPCHDIDGLVIVAVLRPVKDDEVDDPLRLAHEERELPREDGLPACRAWKAEDAHKLLVLLLLLSVGDALHQHAEAQGRAVDEQPSAGALLQVQGRHLHVQEEPLATALTLDDVALHDHALHLGLD
mmetsp:Transcript_82914/g.268236  ORF Transcript_82914/g.268236 Transcript_82914/m.268236 type:complete len:272 (+) Transcript_82914:1343-2158(+)